MGCSVYFIFLLAMLVSMERSVSGQESYCTGNINPCLNGGACRSAGSTYFCQCRAYCSGSHCETCTGEPEDFGPCTPNPCKRDCSCHESCQHAGGYFCRSKSGFLGKNCTIPVPILRCELGRMVFSVADSFVKEYDLELKNSFISVAPSLESAENCEVSKAVNGFHEIQIPLPFTACGTQMKEGDSSVDFTNQVWFNRRIQNSMFDMPIPVAALTCRYERQYRVVTSVRPIIATPAVIIDSKIFTPFISLCKVPACPSTCPEDFAVNDGAVYTVGEMIHVSMSLDSGSGVTGIEEMSLSCSQSDIISNNVVEIVRGGCGTSTGLPVKIRTSAVSDVVCVSFQTPRSLSCQDFYIHAVLQSCQKKDVVTCFDESESTKCASSSRRKRSMESTPFIVGPILIVNGSVGLPSVQIHGMEIDKIILDDLPVRAYSIRRESAIENELTATVPINLVVVFVVVGVSVFLLSLIFLVFFLRSRSNLK